MRMTIQYSLIVLLYHYNHLSHLTYPTCTPTHSHQHGPHNIWHTTEAYETKQIRIQHITKKMRTLDHTWSKLQKHNVGAGSTTVTNEQVHISMMSLLEPKMHNKISRYSIRQQRTHARKLSRSRTRAITFSITQPIRVPTRISIVITLKFNTTEAKSILYTRPVTVQQPIIYIHQRTAY